ncbi:MAG: hypothetical protein WA364_12345 [Candidatus Nitrosopolaris sp.]
MGRLRGAYGKIGNGRVRRLINNFPYYQLVQYIKYKAEWRGSIKINSPSALARATTFTQLNIFLQTEAKEKAYKAKEEQLHKRRINNYVPQPGSY